MTESSNLDRGISRELRIAGTAALPVGTNGLGRANRNQYKLT